MNMFMSGWLAALAWWAWEERNMKFAVFFVLGAVFNVIAEIGKQ